MTESKCTRPYEIELTNEEWIKQCNTEQLAEFLENVEIYGNAKYVSQETKLKTDLIVKHIWAEWLKQPRTPNKQDDYPCNVKGCSLETRQACCGCPDYFEWEKQNR